MSKKSKPFSPGNPGQKLVCSKNKQENIEKLLVIAATEKIPLKSMGV